MKGFMSLAMIAGVAILLTGGAFLFSAFSGGSQSSGLFGWSDTPLLAGVESFITGVYNVVVIISSWVTILVLLVVFLGVQGAFVYAYYRFGKFALHFKRDFEKIIDELLDV